jgi:hypothetical protein
MSSIARLPLPVNEATHVAGWDKTIDDANANNNAAGANGRTGASICTHALAHKTLVCGLKQHQKSSSSSSSSSRSHDEKYI